MRVGWLTTAIFGDLSGYLFGNFKDKASNIIWRYMLPFVGLLPIANE